MPALWTDMARDINWKERLGMVYSTNPHFDFDTGEGLEQETLPKERQELRVSIEKAGRGGKVVTLVKGFVGAEADLKALGKLLKTKCGVGGSAKDGEILVQGDHRPKVLQLLLAEGYTRSK